MPTTMVTWLRETTGTWNTSFDWSSTLDGSGGGSLGTLTFAGDAGRSFGFASDGHGGTNLFLI